MEKVYPRTITYCRYCVAASKGRATLGTRRRRLRAVDVKPRVQGGIALDVAHARLLFLLDGQVGPFVLRAGYKGAQGFREGNQ